MVVMDEYSRYPWAEIISSVNGAVVIKRLETLFGIFEVLRLKSDNGPPLQRSDFREFALYMGTPSHSSTPSNGEWYCRIVGVKTIYCLYQILPTFYFIDFINSFIFSFILGSSVFFSLSVGSSSSLFDVTVNPNGIYNIDSLSL